MGTPRQASPDSVEQAVAAQRFQTAIELHAVGLRLLRVGLQHRFPDESEQQVNQRMEDWLRQQPDFGPNFVDGTAKRRRNIEDPTADLAAVRRLLAFMLGRGHHPDPPMPDLPTRFSELLDEHGRFA